jgi:hypothetical protein
MADPAEKAENREKMLRMVPTRYPLAPGVFKANGAERTSPREPLPGLSMTEDTPVMRAGQDFRGGMLVSIGKKVYDADGESGF